MVTGTPGPIAHTPAAGTDDEQALRRSLLDVVYGQALLGVGASPLVAAILCFAIWSGASHARLIHWLSATVGAMLLRYATVFAFKRGRPRWSAREWGRVFAATLTVTSLVWGFGALYILPADSPFLQAVVLSFVMGMGAGAALIYSAHQAGALLSLYSITLPVTVAFLFKPGWAFRGMVLGLIMLLVLSTSAILRLGGFIRRSFELSLELEKARRQAEGRARTDDLTGLYNRGAFYELAEYLIAQSVRSNRPLTLVLIDLDRLKPINDRHGHAVGDAVLRSFARAMRDSFRGIDLVARLGGDEFGILLPEASVEAGAAAAGRFRDLLASRGPAAEVLATPVTCSIGVAERSGHETLDDLIGRADVALYESKRRGRDRITH